MSYALMFSEGEGLQIFDTETGKVADLAVLEGSWRTPGEAPDDVAGFGNEAQRPQASKPPKIAGDKLASMTVKNFGDLRIRSAAAASYDI